jgi:Haem-degrading
MPELTLAMAEKALRAAREKARELGTPMTVSVVDEAGRLVLCARGDGAGFLPRLSLLPRDLSGRAYRRCMQEWHMEKSACPPILTELSGSLPLSREWCRVSCIRRAVALQLARILTEIFFANASLVHEVSAEPNCA